MPGIGLPFINWERYYDALSKTMEVIGEVVCRAFALTVS